MRGIQTSQALFRKTLLMLSLERYAKNLCSGSPHHHWHHSHHGHTFPDLNAGAAAEEPAAPEPVEPEPLLELTHVLNMVAPRPQVPTAGSNASKLPTPSVAADLLVQSALRMQWPADKRKLAPKDAASTCREAAGVLQEAINQLSAAANVLDCGGSGVREVMKTYCAETKRRKTYAGPNVPGAISPPIGGGSAVNTSLVRAPTVYRGSPPVVRTTGLRV